MFTEISPVLKVPFHDDGRLDADGFGTVVDQVLATGVESVMFPGFASEFHKLSTGEREVLCSLLLERDVAAIISVPDHATYHAVRHALAAVEKGAAAINALPPHQLGPSRDAVIDHLRQVLTAVAPTPVIVQYAPGQTGTALDAATLRALAAEHAQPRDGEGRLGVAGRLIDALADPSTQGRPSPSMVGYAGLQMIAAARLVSSRVAPSPSCTSRSGGSGRHTVGPLFARADIVLAGEASGQVRDGRRLPAGVFCRPGR
jgi:4-hydroxy-tetrahydrodipicolinate synthase